MAINTSMTFLMKGTLSGSTVVYEKFLDVTSSPDLGGNSNKLDATTLSDKAHKYINGIEDNGDAIEFKHNYTWTDYKKAHAEKGTDNYWAVYMGIDSSGDPDGHDGIFEFKGDMEVTKDGNEVDQVSTMTSRITLSTGVEPKIV